ncbi:hypothetical protein BY996DRAFT_7643155 [Phakopsora pachyrhizi]|nr:hypothetical protein BY996DRAFT_7643155 [Phakopsora pachyrhizi]
MYCNTNSAFLALVLALLFFSTMASPAGINIEDKEDVTKCKGSGLQKNCKPFLEKLWSTGKIKLFNTQPQAENDARCLISWKSQENNIEIKSQESLLNVLKKIDMACKNHTKGGNSTWNPNITQYGNFSDGTSFSGVGYFQGKLVC